MENLDLRDDFIKILSSYKRISSDNRYKKIDDIWNPFLSLEARINSFISLKYPTMHVKWSVGAGNWVRVPWLAIFDERITDSVKNGFYCVYLFSEDMSSLNLCLSHGTTGPEKKFGNRKLREMLGNMATKIRLSFQHIKEFGFSVDDKLDLKSNYKLSLDYISGTILYKTYEKNELPSNSELSKDLARLLESYEEYIISENREPSLKTWIQVSSATVII